MLTKKERHIAQILDNVQRALCLIIRVESVVVISPTVSFLVFGRRFVIFLQLRIGYTCVVYRLEPFYEYELRLFYVVERDGAVLEESVCHLSSIILFTSADMLSSVYTCSDREAASTLSAIIRMACSRVNGFGPG